MIKRIKTTGDHLMELLSNPGLENFSMVQPEHAARLEQMEDCYTYVDAYGQVLACCGLLHIWKDRAEAWTIFKPHLENKLLPIARDAKKFLHNHPCKRIESYIAEDFKKGHKWMAMLGFTLEAPCLAQYREGQNHALYSLIKGDT